jgi:tetratricopeptide (TPR) repeat protein
VSDKSQTTLSQKSALIFFGLILGIVLLEIGLRVAGFVITSSQEIVNQFSLRAKDSYVIMCLGESTTFFGGNDSYPRQLEEVLKEKCSAGKFIVLNKGLPGTRTPAIMADLEKKLDKYNPDLVITMMGINDGLGTSVYQDIPGIKFKLFLENFRVYKLALLLKDHILLKVAEVKGRGGRKMGSESRFLLLTEENESHTPRAEASLIKDRKINPRSGEANLELITLHANQENWRSLVPLAREAAEARPEIRPQLSEQLIRIANTCDLRGIFEEVEQLYKSAIEIYPEGDRAYAQLSQYYRKRERFEEAEKMGEKAIGINPQNDTALINLGQIYSMREDWEKGEEMYKRAVEVNPQRIYPLFQLLRRYLEVGRYKEAEDICKKAIEANPENDRLLVLLVQCFEKQGKMELAREYSKKAADLRTYYYNQATARNYQQLHRITAGRGIQLVCVQYPMRSLDNLKRMLPNNDGIIFVDNDQSFKEAVRLEGYNNYFTDYFGGDFGHCTPRGNRLLAENIADIILSEVIVR